MSCWPRETDLAWFNECRSRLTVQNEFRNKLAVAKYFDENALRTLDSALKKTTAFMKKMKTLTGAAVPSLIADLSKLNLSKFVEEMAQAISETKLKGSEVIPVVELCVEIAFRYQKFSELLLSEFRKCLPTKKSDKVTNPAKLRIDLRFLCELVLAGVLQKEGLQVFGAVMTFLTTTDRTEHVNIGLLCSLLKCVGWHFAGLIPLPEGCGDTITVLESDLEKGPISEDNKNALKNMIFDYYNSAISKLEGRCSAMNVIQKKVKRQARTRGDGSAEDKTALEEARNEYEKLKSQCIEFSLVLGQKIRQFNEEPSDDEEDEIAALEMGKALADGNVSLWPDDETQSFYCSLLNIKTIVPKNLYKESEERTLSLNAMETCVDSINLEELEHHSEEPIEIAKVEPDSDGVHPLMEVVNEPVEEIRQNMADFLLQLNQLVNREVTDNCALQFVLHLNTKGNRKRLVKALLGTPGNKLDLIPFNARLLATLAPVMPDVVTEVTNTLLKQFSYYMEYEESKGSMVRLEEKLKCSMFIAELVKFDLVHRAEALKCLRQLVYVFRGHCIDMACTMIETVGFFLYVNSDSHSKIKIILDVMRNKKERLKDPRQRMLVDNSYYAAVPAPEGVVKVVPTLPPMQLFIKETILHVNYDNVTRVLKLLRRIDWNDSELSDLTLKYLSSPWLIPYNNLPHLASVVAGMYGLPAHDWITVSVIDSICENIRLSLEVPGAFNQQAMASITYLGELYNYSGCETGIIFKILYQLISFPEYDSEHWSDFYRLRMVCEMLNVVGEFFMINSNKKKMDYFLRHFYRFYWNKRDEWDFNVNTEDNETVSFPAEIESEFRNCIKNIRGSDLIPTSLEEAEKGLQVFEQQLKDKLDFSEYEVEEEEESLREPMDRSLHQIREEEEMFDEELEEQNMSMSSEKSNSVIAQPEDEEFMRELDRLINETHRNAPTLAPANLADITVPVAAKQKLTKTISFADDESARENQSRPAKVALLSKGRGNKALLKTVVINEEKLHQAWKVEKERQQKEQQDIKRVTLGHSARILAEEEEQALLNNQKKNQLFKYKK